MPRTPKATAPATNVQIPRRARNTNKNYVGIPASERNFAINYDAALKRAEEDLDRAEETGSWANWSDFDGVVPWWVAGANCILEIQQGRTLDYLNAGYSRDLIQALWEELTQAEAFALWQRRFLPYEYRVTKNPTERRRRRKAFVDYVDLLAREKLTALLPPDLGNSLGISTTNL